MNDKALVISNQGLINYDDPKMIQTLKATVAQGLSDPEFLLFSQHCKATGLNPFKKEVWAIKAGGRLQIMTGLNGFLAIANGHPQFDGMEVDVDNDEKPTKATCKIYRKDRKYPAVGVALMREYGKDTPIWKQMPRVMLTKVAKSIAIREAFPQELNGLYTEEEMPKEYAVEATVLPKTSQKPPKIAVPEEVREWAYDMTAIEQLGDADSRWAKQQLKEAGGKRNKDNQVWTLTRIEDLDWCCCGAPGDFTPDKEEERVAQ